MSKIKNSGLDQYGAEPFEQQQFGTAGVEGVNKVISCPATDEIIILVRVSGRNRFVRVQYTIRVERLFQLPHEFNCRCCSTVVDVLALAESDAMLCTDAATPFRHVLVQEWLDQSHDLGIILGACSVEVKVS